MDFLHSFKKNNKKSFLAILVQTIVILAVLLIMFGTIETFQYNVANLTITTVASLILGFFLGLMLHNGFLYVYFSSMLFTIYGFMQIPGLINNPEISTPASFSIMSLFIFAVTGGLLGGIFQFFKYRMDKKKTK
jgi:uncharacterized integral membrane protein